jgi:hypothetical protein
METATIQQRADIGQIENEVRELLHWNKARYAGFMYDTGRAYLTAYFGADKEAIDKLERRREFWNWWKAMWLCRDMVYVRDVDSCDPLNLRTGIYQALHQPAILAAEMHPTRKVLGDDFATIKMTM